MKILRWLCRLVARLQFGGMRLQSILQGYGGLNCPLCGQPLVMSEAGFAGFWVNCPDTDDDAHRLYRQLNTWRAEEMARIEDEGRIVHDRMTEQMRWLEGDYAVRLGQIRQRLENPSKPTKVSGAAGR